MSTRWGRCGLLLAVACVVGCGDSGSGSAADAGVDAPNTCDSSGYDGVAQHDDECWVLNATSASRTVYACDSPLGPSWCYGVDLVIDVVPNGNGSNHRLALSVYGGHELGTYRQAVPKKDELTFNGVYTGGLGTLKLGPNSRLDLTSYTYSPSENHHLAATFALDLVNTQGDVVAHVRSGSLSTESVVDETCGSRQAEADRTCADLLTRCPQLAQLDPTSSWINPNGGSTDDALPVKCDMSDGGWARLIPQYRSYSWYNGGCGMAEGCRPDLGVTFDPHHTFAGGTGFIEYETGVFVGPVPKPQLDAMVSNATEVRANIQVWTYDIEPGCDAGYSATLDYYGAGPLSGPSTHFCNTLSDNDFWSAIESTMPAQYLDNRVLRSVALGTGGDWIFYYLFVEPEVWIR